MQGHQTDIENKTETMEYIIIHIIVIIYCYIIGCKDKTTTWYLNGFPDGSNLGSTVQCRGEAHRYTVHLLY